MVRWKWAAWIAAMVLCACGGGGDSGPTGPGGPVTRTALVAQSQDINPAGERLDYRDRNYFPAAPGDTWSYERQQNGVSGVQTLTRRVEAGSGADVVIAETSLGTTDRETLRRTSEGIVSVMSSAADAPEAFRRAVGDVLEYPEPFYAVGSTRRVIRQGDWGADVDGDGVTESFRLELSQVFVGLETVNLPGGVLSNVAHFRNVTAITLQPSDLKQPVATVTGTEEVWWAPGIGLVRAERSAVNQTGATVEPAYTLVLTGGSVGGRALSATMIDGTLTRIALVHNAMVFDRTRGRYYASVPGSAATGGNRIAVVDAASGALTYSAATVGSEPQALALSGDDSALYVGLDGSGDVVKLRLPDMAELWRVHLPASDFRGQSLAQTLAVSPLDPDVIAVSMAHTLLTPRHGGVALIRAGVIQPVWTQGHTGSNLIAFDASGRFLYGFDTETSGGDLRRIAALADGLREEQVVPAPGGLPSLLSTTLDWSANGLVLGWGVYRTPDLEQLGRVNVQGSCRPHAVAGRLVCSSNPMLDNSPDRALAVVDASTRTVLATPFYLHSLDSAVLLQIVPGPVGQVALRMSTTSALRTTSAVWLFTSPALQ